MVELLEELGAGPGSLLTQQPHILCHMPWAPHEMSPQPSLSIHGLSSEQLNMTPWTLCRLLYDTFPTSILTLPLRFGTC